MGRKRKKRRGPNLIEGLDIPISAFVGDTRRFVQGDIPDEYIPIESQARTKLMALITLRNKSDVLDWPSGYRPKPLDNKPWDYAIRINKKYRIGYNWNKGSPHPTNIEINNHNERN